MKPKNNKISIYSTLIILSIVSATGFYAYYDMNLHDSTFSQDASQRAALPEFQEDSGFYGNRILLRKNKSITVNKTRLVYKGLEKKMIRLDVFLLELDPESAYPRLISKADAKEGIRIGDSRFKLLKVNKKTLQLKMIDVYKS